MGRRCTCGGRGCLETVAAGPAIREQAIEAAASGQSPALAERLHLMGDLEARDAAEAALAGDAGALKIWQQVGWYMGMALTTYQHIYDPHVIVLGGGVAQAGELLLEPIRRAMAELGSPFYLKHLKAVKQASLGTDTGVIGAAGLILLPEAVR
jgi:glucokinase